MGKDLGFGEEEIGIYRFVASKEAKQVDVMW